MLKRQTIGVLAALGMFVVVLCAVGIPHARAGSAAFLNAFEDLPLMPGLVEDAAAGMEFDAPGGRIVEAVAAGRVSRTGVLEFYESTLPQLGWQGDSQGRYAREGEVLRLDISESEGVVTVRFAVSPEASAK